jgi:anti-anti-sigma regulatory factor/PAS domain-containing protein
MGGLDLTRRPGDILETMFRVIHTPDDLAALDLLQTPVWVVDLERATQWWANLACMPLWGASTREEMLANSAASPPASETSRTRLATLRRRFERGETSLDRWTLYPGNARPFVAECRSSGIWVGARRDEEGQLAMLIEARVLGPDETDPHDRRGIEALRYLGELVSLYADSGEGLMRNPAAVRVLGDAGAGDQFKASFADPAQAAEVRALLATGAVFRGEVRVRSAAGERWYETEARPSLDPVTGQPAVLVNQRDVSERMAALAELTTSRERLAAQAEELRSLAAPVIRVGAGVLALPLIGALDRARVEVALTALLAATASGRVHRVVLDLTGAALFDATVADGLLRIVQVLRLQGVAPALSGIRPELARAIVAAGLTLAVPCFQTLEHALASRRTGPGAG